MMESAEEQPGEGLEDTKEVQQETEAQMVRRHKLELRELKRNTDKKLHGVRKGEKKARRDALEEAAKLEADLQKRHAEEMARAKSMVVADEPDTSTPAEVGEQERARSTGGGEVSGAGRKVSRQRRRREAREAQEVDRERRIEKEYNDSPRNVESRQLAEKLKAHDLCVKEMSGEGLRVLVAEHMRKNAEYFQGFLADQSVAERVEAVRGGGWGGQVELRALADALRARITVFFATQPEVLMEPREALQPSELAPNILLSFHRHAYGLGNHYNAVVPSAAMSGASPAGEAAGEPFDEGEDSWR